MTPKQAGLVLVVLHTAIVLFALSRIQATSDGTEQWAISMMLLWTIDIWAIPVVLLFDMDVPNDGFFALSFLGGAVVYFLLGYAAICAWLRIRRSRP
jgi:hypothetical protein